MIVASTDSGNLVHCGNQKAHNPNDKTVIHSGSSAPIFYRHAPSDQKLIFEGRNFVINSRKIRMEHETVTVCPFKDSLIIVSSDSIDLWPSKLIGLLVSSSDASHRTDSETLALISRHRIHICTRKNTGTFSSVVGDYLVLAGEQKLGIFNLSMKTKHSMRLSTEGDAVISCVSGSFFKRSLVAVGWSNGTVQLVDVNALSVIHAFTKCHSAPVSELAFSPFNRYLLISVSLDKHFSLFDVEQNSVVRTILTPAPLKCLSFKQDGVAIAIGTMAGSVLIYDLSTGGKTPSATLEGFSSPISRVWFIENTAQSADRARPVVSLPATPQKLPARGPAVLVERKSIYQNNNNNPDQTINYMDMFSPVGKDPQRQVSPLGSIGDSVPVDKQTPAATPSMPLFDALSISHSSRDHLKHRVSQREQKPVSRSKSTGNVSVASSALNPTADQKLTKSTGDLPTNTSVITSATNSAAVSPINSPTTAAITASNTAPSVSTTAVLEAVETTQDKENCASNHASVAFQNAMESVEENISKVSESLKEKINSSGLSDQQGFSSNLLTSVLNDALYDFRRQMRLDMSNLHLELLKQFEIQQNRFEMILQQNNQQTSHLIRQLITGTFSDNNF